MFFGLFKNWFKRNKLNMALAAKGTNLLSDYDIMVNYLGYSHLKAEEAVARMRVQKLQDVKLQMLSYNPGLGGLPGPDVEE